MWVYFFAAHYLIVLFRKIKYEDIYTHWFDSSKPRHEQGEKQHKTKVK